MRSWPASRHFDILGTCQVDAWHTVKSIGEGRGSDASHRVRFHTPSASLRHMLCCSRCSRLTHRGVVLPRHGHQAIRQQTCQIFSPCDLAQNYWLRRCFHLELIFSSRLAGAERIEQTWRSLVTKDCPVCFDCWFCFEAHIAQASHITNLRLVKTKRQTLLRSLGSPNKANSCLSKSCSYWMELTHAILNHLLEATEYGVGKNNVMGDKLCTLTLLKEPLQHFENLQVL